MPVYDFQCERGHLTEERQGIEIESIPCRRVRCGGIARRLGVYRKQYLGADVPIPVSDMRIGQDVSEYEEAMGEVSYAYDKAEKKMPNYMNIAKKRARAMGAKIA